MMAMPTCAAPRCNLKVDIQIRDEAVTVTL